MIRPLNDNVVLKKEKKINKTASGIVLSNKEEETEYATVVAVGEGIRKSDGSLEPIQLKVNDKVIYKGYSTTSVKVEDESYLIVSANDILAVLE